MTHGENAFVENDAFADILVVRVAEADVGDGVLPLVGIVKILLLQTADAIRVARFSKKFFHLRITPLGLKCWESTQFLV